MALAAIVHRVRTIVYGAGMGERPAIRRAHTAATVSSTSGGLATFYLSSTTEGGYVSAGDILSVYDPADEADAHVFYTLSVSSSSITAINGYDGGPAVSASTDLDSALFEQNPLATGFEIFEAIDTVVANWLWPWVFDVVTATVTTPDLVDGQHAVTSEVEEIISAWQVIGSTTHLIPVSRQPYEVHTTLASTGKLATFDWINGTTGYYTYKAKFVEADEADTELTHLIATGAAAILLGASLSEATLESTKKDNAEAVAQRGSAGDRVMRDFLTLRQNMSEELGRRLPNRIYHNRG